MVAKWAEIERRNQSREGGRELGRAIKGGDVASGDGDDGGDGDVVRGRKMVLL